MCGMHQRVPLWLHRLPVLPPWLLMTAAAVIATCSLLSLLDVYETPYRLHTWGFIVLILFVCRTTDGEVTGSK